MPKQKRLGECLVQAGVITEEQLENALRLQQERHGFLGQILLEMGWITDKQLCQAISQALHVNCVSIDCILISNDIVQLISGSLAVSCGILPLFIHHKTLYLAMENPRDTGAIQLVEYETGLHVKPLMVPPCQLWSMINKYYRADEAGTPASYTLPAKNPEFIEKEIFRKIDHEQRKRLGDFLVETGLLTQAQLTTVLELQKDKRGFLGQLLVDNGWLTEAQLCQALADMLQIENVDIEEAQIDPSVVKLVPDSLAASCNVLPLFIDQNVLYLAMENPLDTGVTQLLQYELGMRVVPLVAPASQIRNIIAKYYHFSSPVHPFIAKRARAFMIENKQNS
ncbi:type IV pilus assembly protein PilB [Candidatus Vecturithrix granuli]|uniref:Type IV pilus assembly protein PilB n=1 Tax=Vecturithrix granuli TaxID=1499967 RepID=A0A081C3M7_VECG1|nr:type IV pilus assembly protein PilB [Candidatus Vecturithrix granuli]